MIKDLRKRRILQLLYYLTWEYKQIGSGFSYATTDQFHGYGQFKGEKYFVITCAEDFAAYCLFFTILPVKFRRSRFGRKLRSPWLRKEQLDKYIHIVSCLLEEIYADEVKRISRVSTFESGTQTEVVYIRTTPAGNEYISVFGFLQTCFSRYYYAWTLLLFPFLTYFVGLYWQEVVEWLKNQLRVFLPL